jgi:hypothetical protein
MYRRLFCAAALSAAAFAAGCGDETPITPVDPTPTEITEPAWTGTLAPNGGVTQPFQSVQAGTVTVIIDELVPANSPAVGVSVGTWNGTSCETVTYNDNAAVGSGVAAVANGAGNLCARIYDSQGKLTGPVTFSATIKHH